VKVTILSRWILWTIFTAWVVNASGEIRFSAVLRGPNDVPPNVSDARGKAVFFLNGNELQYAASVEFFYAWHGWIHGPAAPVTTGSVIFSVAPYGCVTPNPTGTNPGGCGWYGFLTLTDAQAEQLRAQQWYFRVSDGTSAVRGQILLDEDLDGTDDSRDQCPGTPWCGDLCYELFRGGYVDSRGCTVEQLPQLCPCEGPWKGHGEYVKCIKGAVAGFVQEGFMTAEDGRAIEKQAVKSDCGKR